MDDATRLDLDRRVSPLAGLRHDMEAASVPGVSGVAICEVPFLAQVNLRGDVDDPSFVRAVFECLELRLPKIANTVTVAPLVSALWLGPDEWLLVGMPGAERTVVPRLREALNGLHSSIVDVSADRTIIEVSGDRSRHLLAKGCSIDQHSRAFGPRRCAQTNFSRTGVILEQMDATPTWRLYVRSSSASYLARWIIDAMTEYAS